MNLIIPANNSSCLRENIPIELGKYTILAGENNSGKSSIARALYEDNGLLSDYEKIFVPAEKVNPKDAGLKNSATADPFYKTIQSILKPIFDKTIIDGLVKEFDESKEKAEFVLGVNEILKEFGVNKKEFDIKIPTESFEAKIVIKIAQGIFKDLYATDIKEVDIENIGMGTQRLLVVALLQYYERKKINDGVKTLIIFEEPEIYLHPKLKASLYKTLKNISEIPDTIVMITTHDPYFIELGRDQLIYKVSRDKTKKDATKIEKIEPGVGSLPYKSDSEINYFVFDLATKSYFLEVYEHLLSTFQNTILVNQDREICETCHKAAKSDYNLLNAWIAEQAGRNSEIKLDEGPGNNPAVTKLRFKLAHSTEGCSDISEKEINSGIEQIRLLLDELELTKAGR